MKIEESFNPNGSRYEYDFNKCTSEKGWAQIDTEEDASYFGIWINPKEMKILSYMEGDIIEKTAGTKEELIQLVKEMDEFYEWLNIDPGFNEELEKELIELGFEEYLH
jgi:hypothetical protein